MTPKTLGTFGERLAQKKLLAKGYKILETNYRFSKAEVDIIAMKDDILVFIEVKTRSYDHFGQPEEFVSERQERLIFDTAMHYMHKIGHEWEIRFDIISILCRNKNNYLIKHLEDAFFPDQL